MIKAVDFYCLAHTILGCQPHSEDDIAELWSAAIQDTIDSDNTSPLLLVDKKPYWRVKAYPEYKGNRKRVEDPLLNSVVSIGLTYPCPKLLVDGLEADDLAGLLVRYHNSLPVDKRVETLYLLSTDTDWCQLVNDATNVVWVNYGKHLPRIRKESQVATWAYKRHGIFITQPSDVVRVKHILGDSSDNIPRYLGVDLISLQGQGWLDSLTQSGYDVDSITNQIAEIYGQIASRTRISLPATRHAS